jgi:hypothetical protein
MLDPAKEYSRTEIKNLVGGELQSYLPQKDGVILAGCFNLEYNPNAPREIQAGKLLKVVKKAKLLSMQQNNAFPVFLKEKKKDKKYHFKGYFRCVGHSTLKAVLEMAEEKSGRHGELSYILYLEKV